MNINQQPFMDIDNGLLEKVLNISLPIGYTLLKKYIEEKCIDINNLSIYDIKSLMYGNEYVILFKRDSDGKAYMLTPDVILEVYKSPKDANFENIIECCLFADQFIVSEGEEECSKGIYIYKLVDNKFFYIFPLINSTSPKIVETDTVEIINNRTGITHEYPRVHYFNTCDNKYVYIVQEGKACIFSIDGHEIGIFDMFVVMNNDKYAQIEKNGKYNYFSFEKKCVCFDEWFDDCDLPENVDGEWIFRVKKDGVYMAIDVAANDVTAKYKDSLGKWKEES